jgi:hypothetical protein
LSSALFDGGMVPRITIMDSHMPAVTDPHAHGLHAIVLRALAPFLADQATALDSLLKSVDDRDLMVAGEGPFETLDAIATDALHSAVALYLSVVNLRAAMRNDQTASHNTRKGECLRPNCPVHGNK